SGAVVDRYGLAERGTACGSDRGLAAGGRGRRWCGAAMKEPVGTAQRQQATSRGLFIRLLSLPWRLFGMLCGSLLLSILVECVGLHLFWREQGWRHAEAMLDYELEQLSSQFTRSVLVREPGRTAQRLVDGAHEWLFVKSGLQQLSREIGRASCRERGGMPNTSYYLGQGYV